MASEENNPAPIDLLGYFYWKFLWIWMPYRAILQYIAPRPALDDMLQG
jgi:hypothetical protein